MFSKFGKVYLESTAAKVALKYLDKNPDKNIPKLLSWWESVDHGNDYDKPTNLVRRIVDHPDSNWYGFIRSFWTDINPGTRKKFFENLIVNSLIIGTHKRTEAKEKYDCNVPWAILIDPTTACNLSCLGCWAAEYAANQELDYDLMNDLIRQGKELGVYMYIFTGGEPLVKKDEVIRLCEANPDCQFLAFTNGTLIDENFADEMCRVNNFIPAISVEGFESQTDARRGQGTYDAVVRAMKLLKEKQLIFGISCCYTSQNTDTIGSEAFFDQMINYGAKFGWFFTYMPVGVNAMPSLMVSADQRAFMYHQIRDFRKNKPFFTIDFWNDGEFISGCIAGGRNYMHINANGDVEPCAFIHYSDSNIKEKSLVEVLSSPLFQQYRSHQPFNDNMLCPCPLLDNPDQLREMVHNSGAKSTDLQHPEDVDSLTKKCEEASRNWKPVARELWQASHIDS